MEKKEILKLIRRLPEDVTAADVMEELYFRAQVQRGLADVAEGRVLTENDLRGRISKWRKSAGR